MSSTIGLFPLHIVLFPEASYPLHIFEERYKSLIGESIEEDKPFGINLVEGGKMFQVGCRVKVTRVTNRFADGRMDIIVTGASRYRVERILSSDTPYISADVIDYSDDSPNPEAEILEQVVRLYNELIDRVYGEAEQKIVPSEWMNKQASYRIAQKSGLDLLLRQRLLEMKSESERLSVIGSHLERILPKIRRAEQIRTLSRNDGYVS